MSNTSNSNTSNSNTSNSNTSNSNTSKMNNTFNLNNTNFIINLDREKGILSIDVKNFEYKEDAFDEFLVLFESTWFLIKRENLICHLCVNLENCQGNHIFPLHVYIKLANCLSTLNDIFNSNCHGISILTKDSEIWNGIYSIILKLWHPPIRRPMLLTDKISEIKLFIKTNKLIK
jgi:hypothetical protein